MKRSATSSSMGVTSTPAPCSRLSTAGSFSALAAASRSTATVGAGVRAEAESVYQDTTSSIGNPDSAAVGTSGAPGRRRDAVVNSAFTRLPSSRGRTVGQASFVRSPRGVELTDAGRQLVRCAGSSLRTLCDGLDSITRDRAADAPVVQITRTTERPVGLTLWANTLPSQGLQQVLAPIRDSVRQRGV